LLIKKLDRVPISIGRGGVYGATAAIFMEEIPFPGRKIVSLRISQPETVGFK